MTWLHNEVLVVVLHMQYHKIKKLSKLVFYLFFSVKQYFLSLSLISIQIIYSLYIYEPLRGKTNNVGL